MRKRKPGEPVRFRFSVCFPLWLGVALGVGVLLVSYFTLEKYREQIKFVTAVLGGATAIYTAYYVGEGMRLKITRDKQQASFELLRQTNQPEFIKVLKFIDKEVEGPEKTSAVELYKKITENVELQNSVAIVLNTLEDISISIQHDYADEDILYRSLFIIVKRDFGCLRGYIEQLREHTKVKSYFIELEKLYTAWGKGEKISDGKAVPII